MNSKKTGTAYEIIAANYLKEQGVQIIEMNYRISRGEIDIIGKDKNVLVFIEVKYRKNASYGQPWEAILIKKQKIFDIRLIRRYNSRKFIRVSSMPYCGSVSKYISIIEIGGKENERKEAACSAAGCCDGSVCVCWL